MRNGEVKALRRKIGMNQGDFWSRVCCGQSGGSRYESGRRIPKPVQKLLKIAFGTDKQAEREVAKLRKRV